jgi:hypothetical protein
MSLRLQPERAGDLERASCRCEQPGVLRREPGVEEPALELGCVERALAGRDVRGERLGCDPGGGRGGYGG